MTDPTDFRAAAVAASRAKLAALRTKPADLRELPFSACLELDPGGRGRQRRIAGVLLGGLVLGFAGLGGGALIAKLAGGGNAPTPVLWLAGACSVSGFACLFGGHVLSRRMMRDGVRGRYASRAAFDSLGPPRAISIEQGGTFHQFKAIPEDQGVYWADAARRRVVIECLRCLYVIHAADVAEVAVESSSASQAVRVAYRIDDATLLRITMSDNSLLDELRRQTIGLKAPRLLAAVSAALA